MITNACDELSLPRPSIVVSSSDQQARQLLRLANDEGRSLAKRFGWSALTNEQTFTATATSVQVTASAIPTDFAWMVPDTFWNRTSRRQIFGPIDNTEWQQIQGSLVSSINPAFRIRGGTIHMTPTPTTGDTCAYEYISTKWCQSSGGTAQTAWAADSDTGKLDESLMTLGIVWRFLQAKGLDYQGQMSNYEREVTDAILRDGSRSRLSMDMRSGTRRPQAPIMPDTLVF